MCCFKKRFLFFVALPSMISVQAQFTDSATIANRAKETGSVPAISNKAWDITITKKQPAYKQFILPGILVAYGAASLGSQQLKTVNKGIKAEIWQEHEHRCTSADDYLRFAPAVAVYGLNALGIKGKNNFRDRSMIFVLSNLVMTTTVFGVKKLAHVQRPDESDYYSFPSGHTAAAFLSAEFMRQEYKDVSPWYGVAGYAMATATGVLRMYNNRHWASDVLAGAGIGIASTRLAYLVYPSIKRKFFKDKPMNAVVMPYYQPGGGRIAMVYHFR